MDKTIIINQLGEHRGHYAFIVNKQGSGIYICIPGHGADRDGPIYPDYPEQKEWMQEHSDLKDVWHLTWECKDQEELNQFLQKLENLKAS